MKKLFLFKFSGDNSRQKKSWVISVLSVRVFILLFSLSLLKGTLSFAQNVQITGTVTDAVTNIGIPGASVLIKGSSSGTISDENGKYSIAAPKSSVLTFSFIGYLKQEIPVNGQTVIDVKLKEDSGLLNEVVITALGVSKEKRQLGYSVTDIAGAKLATTNEVSPISALQGRIPGVQIDQGAGGLTGNTKILIRGNSTLGVNNQPIFVVDGVILDNDLYDGSGRDFGNNIKNLNMEDFESVSVLKGSAAAALYGTRAINGVILITTKKGYQRKGIGVNVSQTFTAAQPYRGPDFQNEYGAGTVGGFFTDTREPNYKSDESWTTKVFPVNSQGQPYIDRQIGRELENWGPRFAGQQVLNYDGTMTTYQAYPDNYLDAFQTGKGSLTNIAIDGGTAESTFRLSYNRNQSKGINFRNELSKNAFNLRVTHKLNKFLSVDVTGDYTATEGTNPPSLSLNPYIWVFGRSYDTKKWMQRENYIGYNGGAVNPGDANEPNKSPRYGDPYWFNIFENTYTQKEQMVRGRIALTGNVTDWMKVQVEGNLNNVYTKNETKELGQGANFTGGKYALGHSIKETRFLKWMAIFNKKITRDLDFNGYVGGESQRMNLSFNLTETDGGLSYPGNYFLANSVNAQKATGGVKSRRAYNSLYASADFGYKDQLFLQTTWRGDWSSALTYKNGTGNNFYNYPSASLSWVFSQTLNNSLPSWITYGKLRGNLAALGGDIDPFTLNAGFSFKDFTDAGGFGNQPMATFSSSSALQPNIKPLRKIAKEIGLEMKFFKNRLGFDISVYRDNTRNQPVSISSAMESGVNKILINAGNIQNTGIEISLDATPLVIGAFKWNSTLTFSRNRNLIIDLYGDREYYPLEDEVGGGNDLIPYAKVGGAYGVIRTKIAAKRYNVEGSPNNGKQVLSWRSDARAAFPARSNEWKDVGDINAKFRSGWDNTFTYKRLSVNVLLDAKIGGDMITTSLRYGMHTGIFPSSLKGRDAEHGGITWTSKFDNKTYDDGIIPDGVFDTGQTITQSDGTSVNVGGMSYQEAYDKGYVEPTHLPQFMYRYGSASTAVGDYWIVKNSWISLRQLSVSYQVPQAFVDKIKLNTLSISFVGRDLLYLYNSLPNNINPASNVSNSTAVQKEVGFIPPMTRNLGVTLRAGF